MANTDDHECAAHARPVIDDSQDGEPILSATISNSGAEVYMTCRVCGEDLTFEYDFADANKS